MTDIETFPSGGRLHLILRGRSRFWFANEVEWSVAYDVGPGLTVGPGKPDDEYKRVHDLLWREGRIDHAFGQRDEAEMFDFLKWDRLTYVPLAEPR